MALVPVKALDLSSTEQLPLPLKRQAFQSLPSCIHLILFGLDQLLFRVLLLHREENRPICPPSLAPASYSGVGSRAQVSLPNWRSPSLCNNRKGAAAQESIYFEQTVSSPWREYLACKGSVQGFCCSLFLRQSLSISLYYYLYYSWLAWNLLCRTGCTVFTCLCLPIQMLLCLCLSNVRY